MSISRLGYVLTPIRRSFSPDGTQPRVSNMIELLRAVVKPHDRPSTGQSRFTVVGPSLACGEHALNGIALVFNELATNALKYRALATDHGHIDIQWTANSPTVTFTWREQGGPAVAGIPHAWNPEGLLVQIDLPVERLAY